jgi:hypothetical protein
MINEDAIKEKKKAWGFIKAKKQGNQPQSSGNHE